MAKRDIPEPDLQPVPQPLGAFQQTAPRPAWAYDPDLAVKLAEEYVHPTEEIEAAHAQAAGRPSLKGPAREYLKDPLVALEMWAQDQVENHGLVDIKFFPRHPDDPPVDLNVAAAEALRMLTTPGEDVSDQDL